MGKQRKDVATHSQPLPGSFASFPNHSTGILRSEAVSLHSLPDIPAYCNIRLLLVLQEELLPILCRRLSLCRESTSKRDAVYGHRRRGVHTHMPP